MKVEVFGPGCKNCESLKENVKEAAAELGLEDLELTSVEEPEEIVNRGVMSTPALAVDGETKVSGRVPSKEEIKEMLG